MKTDKEIPMSDLPKNEAWELFSEKAGGVISSSIESIARLVCDECHGLPLALIVVGRALRRENNVSVWEYALNSLRSSQFELEGMEKDVFSLLKFSYDYLKNDTLRECFLYCALFPGDYEIDIDRLIIYWVSEGLVDINKGFSHALDKGRHVILKELIDCCLLEMHTENMYHFTFVEGGVIRMHDVIRDMAIKITSERGTRLLVNAGNELDGCMGENDLVDDIKINFTDNHLETLPDVLNIHRLSTLLLRSNRELKHIPNNFFISMINLRVLDLSYTNINSLPHSINWLVNLQALSLQSCHSLTDISHIGRLGRLMLLDLSDTPINELPDTTGELNCLCILDLFNTYGLEKISTGTLSKLTKLEFLEMQGSAYFTGGSTDAAVIHDIGCLSHLHHLALDVSSNYNAVYLMLPKLKKLASFDIKLVLDSVTYKKRYDGRGFSEQKGRRLELRHITHSSPQIFELARYANKLVVRDMDMLDSVSSLGAGNLKNLKELEVYGCDSISKAIIDGQEEILLPHLEVLELGHNLKLPCVWEVKGVAGTFRSIKFIYINECICATHNFSTSVISELGCLEDLTIYNCGMIEQIARGAYNNQIQKIPKLEYLGLSELPSLNSLWEGQVFLPSLRRINISGCKTLKCLPLSNEIAPALRFIQGESEWWDDLEWMNKAAKSYFQPYFRLR